MIRVYIISTILMYNYSRTYNYLLTHMFSQEHLVVFYVRNFRDHPLSQELYHQFSVKIIFSLIPSFFSISIFNKVLAREYLRLCPIVPWSNGLENRPEQEWTDAETSECKDPAYAFFDPFWWASDVWNFLGRPFYPKFSISTKFFLA